MAESSGENLLDSSQGQGEKWKSDDLTKFQKRPLSKTYPTYPKIQMGSNGKGFPNGGVFRSGYVGDFSGVINPWKSKVSLCECDLHGLRTAATCDAHSCGVIGMKE